MEGRREAALPLPAAFRCFRPARTVMDTSATCLHCEGAEGQRQKQWQIQRPGVHVTGSRASRRSCSSSSRRRMQSVTPEVVTPASVMTTGLDHSDSRVFPPWFRGQPPDCHFPGCGTGGSSRGRLFRGVARRHSRRPGPEPRSPSPCSDFLSG